MLDVSGLSWRKSSHSGAGGNCVEIALLYDGKVAVRDSKNPHGDVLVLPHAAMTAWLGSIKSGTFDISTE